MSLIPWSRSLSVRVLFVFLLATAALSLVLWLTLCVTFQRNFSEDVKPYFTQYLIDLQSQIGDPPDINIAKEIADNNHNVTIEIDAPGYRWSSSGTFIDINQVNVKLQRVGDSGVIFEAGFYQGNFVLRTFSYGYISSFILAEQLSPDQRRTEMWLALGATILILSVLFFVISLMLNPVRVIERGIRRIGDGEVFYRLDVSRTDEIGSLADSINKMADNVEEMLEAKRQLLLAISHELRTPITRANHARQNRYFDYR